MPWISLPSELAVPYLLDLQGISMPLRERLARLPVQFIQGGPESVLSSAESCYGIAKRAFDRYGQALALVFEAEAYRRLALWEDGLDAIRNALRWLELQAAPVGRYNEALTVYLEGVIHFTLQSRERTVQTFSYAQHLLAESERHWGREGYAGRVADCRNAIRWMAQLLDIQEGLPPLSRTAVLPVYEVVNRALIRTDAMAVRASYVALPAEVLAPYLPDGSVGPHPSPPTGRVFVDQEGSALHARSGGGSLALPLLSAMLPFPYLDPSSSYVAVRAPTDLSTFGQVRKGDVLIIEVTGAGISSDESLLTSDVPFARRSDGRIEIVSCRLDTPGSKCTAGGGFVGIPRVLIREGDQR